MNNNINNVFIALAAKERDGLELLTISCFHSVTFDKLAFGGDGVCNQQDFAEVLCDSFFPNFFRGGGGRDKNVGNLGS